MQLDAPDDDQVVVREIGIWTIHRHIIDAIGGWTEVAFISQQIGYAHVFDDVDAIGCQPVYRMLEQAGPGFEGMQTIIQHEVEILFAHLPPKITDDTRIQLIDIIGLDPFFCEQYLPVYVGAIDHGVREIVPPYPEGDRKSTRLNSS